MDRSYISLEHLENHAASPRYAPEGAVSPAAAVSALRGALSALRRREKRLSLESGAGEADRWLLDNLYLAERETADTVSALRAAGRLRRCADGVLVTALCRDLLSSGGGAADDERVLAFLRGCQRVTVLRGQELRLFPAALAAAAVELLAVEYAREEPDPRRVSALFTTLRALPGWDMTDVLERSDRVDEILRRDPEGAYPRMDVASRREYRKEVERLARRFRLPEHKAAQSALDLASEGIDRRRRHVGYYLYDRPLGREKPDRSGLYILWNLLLPAALALLSGLRLRSIWAGLLSLLPLGELTKRWTDALLLRLTPRRRLPRLELAEGIPPEGAALCVVSMLLTGKKGADAAVRAMEEYAMANRDSGDNLRFGLLCDLPESREALQNADRELLGYAAEAVKTLNDRYGGGFYLLTRERVWSDDTGSFAPWERKRGALLELCRLLAGEESALTVSAGDAAALRGTVYVLTLDADTRLEPETARALVGAALHPLCRPAVDMARGVVSEGRGILHPRIAVELTAAVRTPFARLFAPPGGAEPYPSDAQEIYMDRYGSGGFAGKGLIHVRAFLDCVGRRFPEGTVLSHDALEGAFLRGGYVGDVELTDGFPSSPESYMARQHRWVRGDWQNLPWLLREGRELPKLERWRLFDSLRRSLVSTGELAALGAWLFRPGGALWLPAFLSAACLASPWLEELSRRPLRPREEAGMRLRCRTLHGPGETFLRPAAGLLLLPLTAWTELSAALTGLWRLLLSGKRRLEWKTAAQAENAGRGDVLSCCGRMWLSIALGVFLLGFSGGVPGCAMGAVWLVSPVWAASLGRERPSGPDLSETDRDWLSRRAAEIWRFFRDNAAPETHWLPPDNVQLSPPAEPAERVSPTNLGLTLLAVLSALELGLADENEASERCGRLLTAAESMERWEGHFYNWYSTRTLRPLEPRYVSTVDSGNLCACLRTAAAGLREHGHATLAARAEALYLAMDFRPLYDQSRRLFRIGMTPGETARAGSWYDLLESEERLTGYLAVASGQVPKKHWERLGRARTGRDGFRGMVSWTGTMFEYLMPELMLPLYRDSHLWESAKFAVYAQKKRPLGPKGLWGASESAFAALDGAGHYRYKAHGVPALALCRDMGRDAVLAPYASFLALAVSPRAAVKNLRAMEEAGYLGPCGFWEAVDFTPGRGDGRGTVVGCFMAHHLGMSLCAAVNVLRGGVLRRWFLSDAAMGAYVSLLKEKVPLGGTLLRRRETRPPRTVRGESVGPIRRGDGVDFLSPAAAPLSNRAYELLFTESGVSFARTGGLRPYRAPSSPREEGHGLELFVKDGQERFSLLPESGDGTAWTWSFSAAAAVLRGERPGWQWTVVTELPAGAAGERRRITLRRKEPAEEAGLYLGFEPVLLPEKDRRAHPSFARLGLFTRERDGALSVRRLARGSQSERFLALACGGEAAFSSDFRLFPGRNRGGDFQPNTGWQNEPFVCARAALPAGERECTVVFALTAASDEDTACSLARTMARGEGGFPWAELLSRRLELEEREQLAALSRLRALVWPRRAFPGEPGPRREELWRLGLSGDLPLHVVECDGPDAVVAAALEIKRHALLTGCGVGYDPVLLTEGAGDYRQTVRSETERLLERLERPDSLEVPGGVHFARTEDASILRGAAALWSGRQGPALPERDAEALFAPPRLRPSAGESPTWTFDREARFSFLADGVLPPRAWTNVLTGGGLGWLAADAGTGFLWYENARECPLTPWTGDPLAAAGPERLWAETKEGPVSFFAAPGEETRVAFGFGSARWEKTVGSLRLALTAFLLPDRPVRIFLLESSEPVKVRWCAPLQMAPEREDAPACAVDVTGPALTARNPRSPYFNLTLTARCSEAWTERSADADRFCFGLPGEGGGSPGLCGSFTLRGEAVLLMGAADAAELLDGDKARRALAETEEYWRSRLGREPENAREPWPVPLRWAAWQALSCRVLGRTSLYQSGGAIGFRDQLQDRVNLLDLDAPGCGEHILVCCRHQFAEGDVQHWWHPGEDGADKGVRTRCSDDLLWLPWAVCEYLDATGDDALLSRETPFLAAAPLKEGETARYERPEISVEWGTVAEHCRRALRLVLARGVGAHRLLLMGSGDWNDGFDAMGPGAESVWLTFFAASVLRRFGNALEKLGDPEAEKYAAAAAALGSAANDAWAGDRFVRAYYGDGAPLPGVDSVAQSFAAFCPYADPDRVRTALDTALRELWDRERGLVCLYRPAVGPEDRSPGYVQTYGPGFRENGGQYTHAAVWLAMACLRTGREADGRAILRDIALSVRKEEYGAEPCVLGADVAAAPGLAGRAGWSWYTGAAGWWRRAVREAEGES